MFLNDFLSLVLNCKEVSPKEAVETSLWINKSWYVEFIIYFFVTILYHIKNVHEWEDHLLFKECTHREYTLQEMKSKAWLKESSFACAALKKIVLDKRLLNDLKYLTDFNHTGTLEVYYSLYNKYSPKRLHFSYPGMIARAQLGVLDFNSGVG